MGVPLWGCMQASPPGSAMSDSSVEISSPTAPHTSSRIESTELPAPLAKPLTPILRSSAVETVTTVGPRDTLYTVARAHNVPIRDLIQWNGLDAPYDLKPGQVLRLPPSHDHMVAPGETVYSISRRYNVDMTELVRSNDIAPPYAISDGQHLKLPPPTLGNTPAGLPPGSTAPTNAVATAAPLSPPSPPTMAAAPHGSTGTSVAEVPLPPPEYASPKSVPQNSPAVQSTVQPAIQNASLETPSPAGPQAPSAGARPEPESKPLSPKIDADIAPQAKPLPPKVDSDLSPEIEPEPKPDMFLWPVRGKILSGYGAQKGGLHNDGINIATARGTPVHAAADGTVIYAGNELRGFGNLILIKHANGWTTAYAHNDRLLVARGEAVKAGQVIAKAGSSGSVTSPQVHFEIRRGTHAVNPNDYLASGNQTASSAP